MSIELPNPHLKKLDDDHLFHLGLSKKCLHTKGDFSNIKLVVMCGSVWRAKRLASYFNEELQLDDKIEDILDETDRYDMYKVGPILVVSHGIGTGSMSIILHETVKLLNYGKATDVSFIRIGTCGGLGLKPGTLVLTSEAVNGLFEPYLEMHILGDRVRRPSTFDEDLIKKMEEINEKLAKPFELVVGKTLCAKDFYEEQGRLDGAICNYTAEQKKDYLKKALNFGIKNFEMESLVFGATMRELAIPAAVICVVIVDRMKSDQVIITQSDREEIEDYPCKIVAELVKGMSSGTEMKNNRLYPIANNDKD